MAIDTLTPLPQVAILAAMFRHAELGSASDGKISKQDPEPSSG